MPANHPIHLALTKEQNDWLETEFLRTGNLRSKIVQDLIDARRQGPATDGHAPKILDALSRMEAQQQRMAKETAVALSQVLLLVKEIFRESSANLYRLNAIIDDMPDPIHVRQRVNEFVRGQEREIQERLARVVPEVSRG